MKELKLRLKNFLKLTLFVRANWNLIPSNLVLESILLTSMLSSLSKANNREDSH